MRLREVATTTPFISLAISIGSALILMPFSLIDYDRFHDGFMLASALAVHSGLTVHGEVFNHFGPVNPWLQGIALYMPVSPAVAVRWLTILEIAGTLFLMAEMGRKAVAGSPIKQQAGVAAAIAWFVSSDIWGVGPMRPWPVFLFIFLLMLGTYLALRSWAAMSANQEWKARLLIASSGVALALAAYTRVASGIVLIIVLIACACVMLFVQSTRKRFLLWGLAGFVPVAVAIPATLMVSGSGEEFIYNTITLPLEIFAHATDLAVPVSFTWLALTHFGPALLVGFIVLKIGQKVFGSRFTGSVLAASASGVAILTTMAFTMRIVPSADDYAGYYSWGAGIMLLFTCVIVTIVGTSIAIALKIIRSRQVTPSTFCLLSLVALAIIGVQEVSPDYTVRHIWWSLPFGLLLVFSVMPKVVGSYHWLSNPLILPISAIAAYGVYIGTNSLERPRVPAPTSSIASGMFVSSLTSAQMAEDINVLQRGLADRKAVYLTIISDLSISRGNYSSVDAYFNCFLYEPVMTRIYTAEAVVVGKEDDPSCPNLAIDYLTEQGFRLSARTERYSVYVRE